MGDIDVRPARDADCEAMRALVNAEIRTGVAVWHETERTPAEMRDWVDRRRAPGRAVIVAERAGQVVGYGGYGPFRPHSGYALTAEHSLYVDADHRGHGIGGMLLGDLVRRAGAQDLHALIGGIEARNTASIALHRRHGFEETGRLPEVGRKFGHWLTLVFMQRTLTRP